VDYFRGVRSPETDRLDGLLGEEPLAVPDVVLTEVLQGFTHKRDFEDALRTMGSLLVVGVGGRELAVQAARNFRVLRAEGVTIRKTIDTLIATCCIEGGHALLYSDRDFDPFVEYLGLEAAI
jgi:predicted nucleic acid-binding protein